MKRKIHPYFNKLLVKFRKEFQKRGLVESYSDISEFAQKLNRQLNQRLNDTNIFKGQAEAPVQPSAEKPQFRPGGLSEDALAVLIETAKGDGRITKVRHLGRILIQLPAGTVDTSTPRLAARWTAAIDELEANQCIRALAFPAEIYEVTEKGYQLCDKLNAQGQT